MSSALQILSLMARLEFLAGLGSERSQAPVWGRRHSRRYGRLPHLVTDCPQLPIAAPPGHARVSGLTVEEAEDLYEWLKSEGRTCSQYYDAGEQGYTVSFR